MVWSDPEIQQLSREFVPVADEVYMLYPEDAGNLARVAKDPAHLLFKRYGESMPRGDWNHPGTKQGIYLMGPDGEYLEGKFAASSDPQDVRARLRRALARWAELRDAKHYADRPVPAIAEQVPPGLAQRPLLLRVSLRDLPRSDKTSSSAAPPRWRPGGFDDRDWNGFTRWAWNQNWAPIDEPRAFVPRGAGSEEVDRATFRRLCREVLVDNVRGQTPAWRDAEVQVASLRMQRTGTGSGAAATWTIAYDGEARMVSTGQRMELRLHGSAVWDVERERMREFVLVALGRRQGAGSFNQRTSDTAPAPIGFALRQFTPAEPAAGGR
jgi:hypothetical protein